MKKKRSTGLSIREKKVLYSLIDNAKSSDYQIAKSMGISQPAVFKIRKKLEKKGIIERYSVIYNHSKIGIKTVCFLICEKKGYWSADKTKKFISKMRKEGHCAELINTEKKVILKYYFKNKFELEAYQQLNASSFNGFFKKIDIIDCGPANIENFDRTKLIRKIVNHNHHNNSLVKKLNRKNNNHKK